MSRLMCGAVEFSRGGVWTQVIDIGSVLFKHADLNGCLFGVDNWGGFEPLFPARGLPVDCAILDYSKDALGRPLQPGDLEDPSWVSWSELRAVDWEVSAVARDQRITEFALRGGEEVEVTKSLNPRGLDWVREALHEDPESVVRTDGRAFRRLLLKRKDCLADTEFPLVMKLMACLAERFGEDSVRVVVWFD